MSKPDILELLDDIIPSKNSLDFVVEEITNRLINNQPTEEEQQHILENNNQLDELKGLNALNSQLCESNSRLDQSHSFRVTVPNLQPVKVKKNKSKLNKVSKKKNGCLIYKRRYNSKKRRENILKSKAALRGMKNYGKKETCYKCNNEFDKNYLFIYSEDTKPTIQNKPYICFWCSLNIPISIMLRDWDITPEIPTHCYRCLCDRSKCRFSYENGCYCMYCSLKKKRDYIINKYFSKQLR